MLLLLSLLLLLLLLLLLQLLLLLLLWLLLLFIYLCIYLFLLNKQICLEEVVGYVRQKSHSRDFRRIKIKAISEYLDVIANRSQSVTKRYLK